jgi:hypothetical protein
MTNWFLAKMGATLDERITNLLSLILCAALPILFALAETGAHVPPV